MIVADNGGEGPEARGAFEALLIEDCPLDARMIQEMLRSWRGERFELTIVGTLEDGKRLLRSRSFDVVLLDLNLPDSMGAETFEQMRALSEDIPIVILSGIDDESAAVTAVKHGAQDYLVKGQVDQQLLVRSLRYAVERARSQTQLKASQARYRLLVDNAPVGIMFTDGQGKILELNPKLLEIIGSRSSESTRRINMFRFPPLVEAGIAGDFQRCLDTGGSLVSERSYTSLWGKTAHLRYHLQPVFERGEGDGRVAGILAVVEDITDRVKAEEEKKRLEAQLLQSQKMESIGRLAGGIAHDFNNLLTGITGNVSMALLDLSPNDPLYDILEEIRLTVSRASELTSQLLAFSKKQVKSLKVVNLNEVVSNMSSMIRRLIGEHISPIIKLNTNVPMIEGDPSQLEQILVNLVVNARDAMPTGGTLTIETGSVYLEDEFCERHGNTVVKGEYARLTVEDNGVGIPKEMLDRIFDPFFTTKEKDRGTGLGLSVVYGIVQQHNGFIKVESTVGQGTRFDVYIPRTERDQVNSERTFTSSGPMPGGHETILMVEDEPLVRDMNLRILKRLGYQVLSAKNAGEALLLCEQFEDEIELLMTDVVMPYMSGGELAERLLQLRPEMKVLFTSGYTDDMILRDKIINNDAHFLSKPYTPRSLAVKIRGILDGLSPDETLPE